MRASTSSILRTSAIPISSAISFHALASLGWYVKYSTWRLSFTILSTHSMMAFNRTGSLLFSSSLGGVFDYFNQHSLRLLNPSPIFSPASRNRSLMWSSMVK